MASEKIDWDKFNKQVEEESALHKRLKQRETEIIPAANIEIKEISFSSRKKIIDFLEEESIEFSEIKINKKATENPDLLELKFNDITSSDYFKVIGFLKENGINFDAKI